MTETPKSIAFHSFNEKDVNFCNLGEKKKTKENSQKQHIFFKSNIFIYRALEKVLKVSKSDPVRLSFEKKKKVFFYNVLSWSQETDVLAISQRNSC